MLLWFETTVRVPGLWTVARLSLCEGPFAALQALCRDMGDVLEQRALRGRPSATPGVVSPHNQCTLSKVSPPGTMGPRVTRDLPLGPCPSPAGFPATRSVAGSQSVWG